MINSHGIYKCGGCDAIVEVLYGKEQDLECCGKPMELLEEQTEGEKQATHKPIIESKTDAVDVKVGSVPHAMDPSHYIVWVEVDVDGKIYRQHLKPGDKPEAQFNVKAQNIQARSFCNTHGFWVS